MRFPKAEVTLPTDSQVLVTRSFNAPSVLVYRAHTEPALMRRWQLGYPGWTMPVCEMDVRGGGEYRWRWRYDEDGKEFGFHGTFQEVVANQRLRYTQVFDPGTFGGDMGDGSLITVDLVEDNGTTTLTCLMEFGSKEARDAAMSTGMTDGMEVNYQGLDRLVTEL
ncbi:MAG TPA: SRPBCC family protein [Polyangiaceae bacterium]